MVEGARYCPPPRSPPPLSSNTPSHPYSWDTPIFTWGEGVDTAQEDTEVRIDFSLYFYWH